MRTTIILIIMLIRMMIIITRHEAIKLHDKDFNDKTMIMVIMEELVTKTIVTVIMMTYRRNSNEKKN